MISYERNIKDKLFVLRLLFIALAIGLFISITKGFVNLHYVIITALVFGSLIKLTTLKAFGKEIEVTRYFVFGLLPLKWIYDEGKNNIQLYSYHDEINNIGDSETTFDLVGLFSWRKVKFQFMRIQPKKLIFKLGDIDVNLSDYEYELISEIVPKENSL